MARKREVYINLETLVNVISLLDSYRIYRCEDFRWVDKAIKEGKLGKLFKDKWKNIRRILQKMAQLPMRLPNVVRLMKLQIYVTNFGYIFPIVSIFLMMIHTLYPQEWLSKMLPYIAAFALVNIVIVFIARPLFTYKIASEINQYYKKHPKKFQLLIPQLKREIQSLIDILCYQIEHLNEEPANYKIQLYNIDYNKINIVKEPKMWRRYYIVTPRPRLCACAHN